MAGVREVEQGAGLDEEADGCAKKGAEGSVRPREEGPLGR